MRINPRIAHVRIPIHFSTWAKTWTLPILTWTRPPTLPFIHPPACCLIFVASRCLLCVPRPSTPSSLLSSSCPVLLASLLQADQPSLDLVIRSNPPTSPAPPPWPAAPISVHFTVIFQGHKGHRGWRAALPKVRLLDVMLNSHPCGEADMETFSARFLVGGKLLHRG